MLKRQAVRVRSEWVGSLTIFVLLFALAVGGAGLIANRSGVDPHLTVETLAVVAALTGIFWERRFTRSERHSAAVRAIREELTHNIKLLEGDPGFRPQDIHKPVPRIYPRVEVDAVAACLAQAILTEDRDKRFIKDLTEWRNEAQIFNRTLELIESTCYILSHANLPVAEVITNADRELQCERVKIVEMAKKALSTLDGCLPDANEIEAQTASTALDQTAAAEVQMGIEGSTEGGA